MRSLGAACSLPPQGICHLFWFVFKNIPCTWLAQGSIIVQFLQKISIYPPQERSLPFKRERRVSKAIIFKRMYEANMEFQTKQPNSVVRVWIFSGATHRPFLEFTYALVYIGATESVKRLQSKQLKYMQATEQFFSLHVVVEK